MMNADSARMLVALAIAEGVLVPGDGGAMNVAEWVGYSPVMRSDPLRWNADEGVIEFGPGMIDRMRAGYKGIDLDRELARMNAWTIGNRSSMSRKKDLLRFVRNWFARAEQESKVRPINSRDTRETGRRAAVRSIVETGDDFPPRAA